MGRSPSSTVQAPQLARSQPSLAPVRLEWLRSASSSVTRGSSSSLSFSPLIFSVIGTAPGPMVFSALAFSSSAATASVWAAAAVTAAVPSPLRNERRECADGGCHSMSFMSVIWPLPVDSPPERESQILRQGARRLSGLCCFIRLVAPDRTRAEVTYSILPPALPRPPARCLHRFEFRRSLRIPHPPHFLGKIITSPHITQ